MTFYVIKLFGILSGLNTFKNQFSICKIPFQVECTFGTTRVQSQRFTYLSLSQTLQKMLLHCYHNRENLKVPGWRG